MVSRKPANTIKKRTMLLLSNHEKPPLIPIVMVIIPITITKAWKNQ